MTISRNDWDNYVKRLSKINLTAANKMREFLNVNGYDDVNAIINYAYSLNSYYGEAAAALACEMYDEIAEASGVTTPPAIPAAVLPESYVAQTMRNVVATAPITTPEVVGRMVKQASADTMLQNAQRDGAEFAWIPHGDTCAFCITLASRGWQRTRKKTLITHAEHIHSHCDCNFAIRFNEKTNVEGYDPDKYADIYYDHDGDINAIRREQYAENKDKINAQKREAYRLRKEIENSMVD